MQTFVPSRSATLTSASYTTFQNGSPNAPLQVGIYKLDSSMQKVGSALTTTTIAASSVGWSPRNLVIAPNVAVTAGTRYGIVASSSATVGCYGLTYNDSAPYPGGGEAYSSNGGSSFVAETNRSSKFWSAVGLPNLARLATVTTSSSVEGFGWGISKVNDGRRTSDSSSMGWSSDGSLTSNHPEFVQVDVNTVRTVGRVDLYPRNDVGNAGQGFPVDFTVKVSTDGVTWITVVTQTGYAVSNGAAQSFPFTAQSARYVRIQMTRLRNTNPNDPNYRAQLAEVELY
jgi:hypothetical protein